MKKICAVLTGATLAISLATPFNKMSFAEDSDNKLRVMPLGDSITDGFSTVGGYRVPLCNLLEENGLSDSIDFIGPNWGGDCYDPNHAGYSGYSIDNIPESISGQRTGISSFIDWLLTDYPPDVVMLQIGTNDILSIYELESIDERLENLVDTIFTYLPDNGMMFLATVPVMDAGNSPYISEYFFTVESMDGYVEDYNASIKKLVEKKQQEGKNIQLADINSVLTKEDLCDGVHPSVEGYGLMAEYWYDVLSNYMNNIEPSTDTTTEPSTDTTTEPSTDTTTEPSTDTTTEPSTDTTTEPSTDTTTEPSTDTTTEPSTDTTTEPSTDTTTEPSTDTTTEPSTDTTTVTDSIILGDANCDGIVSVADVVATAATAAYPEKFTLSEQGTINADLHNTGDGISVSDASIVQELAIGIYSS